MHRLPSGFMQRCVRFPEDLDARLAARAAADDRAVAYVIRVAVEAYLEAKPPARAPKATVPHADRSGHADAKATIDRVVDAIPGVSKGVCAHPKENRKVTQYGVVTCTLCGKVGV